MKQALVDIEDSRFYEHHGLDIEGTARALVRNLVAGEVMEGGSTHHPAAGEADPAADGHHRRRSAQAATESSVGRKLREARLALALEEQYTKDEILTRYLNLVYFGEGAYGIQAAAQRYFSVNAADLTLPQAAMLAGLVQTPSNDDPLTDPERARERRNQVLQRMLALGHITAQRRRRDRAARRSPSCRRRPRRTAASTPSRAAFFCDYLQRYLTQTLGIAPGRARERRPDHQDDAAPGPAGLRRPGGAQPPGRWATRWPGCSPRSSPAPATCWR